MIQRYTIHLHTLLQGRQNCGTLARTGGRKGPRIRAKNEPKLLGVAPGLLRFKQKKREILRRISRTLESMTAKLAFPCGVFAAELPLCTEQQISLSLSVNPAQSTFEEKISSLHLGSRSVFVTRSGLEVATRTEVRLLSVSFFFLALLLPLLLLLELDALAGKVSTGSFLLRSTARPSLSSSSTHNDRVSCIAAAKLSDRSSPSLRSRIQFYPIQKDRQPRSSDPLLLDRSPFHK